MKINIENSNVLDFIAESEDELPLAIDLAHRQAVSFRKPIWCEKCKEYHTLGTFFIKHKKIPSWREF